MSAALAVVYLILKPRSPDLAAHLFRSDLFGREGFTIWNGQWYGGHHTPAYSLLSPPLGWLLGPQLMGALSAVAATACFTELARGHFGAQAARWGTLWFGVGLGDAAVHQPAAVRARHRLRPGRGAGAAARPAAAGPAAGAC